MTDKTTDLLEKISFWRTSSELGWSHTRHKPLGILPLQLDLAWLPSRCSSNQQTPLRSRQWVFPVPSQLLEKFQWSALDIVGWTCSDELFSLYKAGRYHCIGSTQKYIQDRSHDDNCLVEFSLKVILGRCCTCIHIQSRFSKYCYQDERLKPQIQGRKRFKLRSALVF